MVVPFWSGRRDNRPVCPDCSIRRCGARAKRPYQVESQVAPFRKVGCHVEVGQPLKEFYEYPYLGIGERVGQLCLVGGDVMALRISRRAPISDLR